jgi:hypothetical protein
MGRVQSVCKASEMLEADAVGMLLTGGLFFNSMPWMRMARMRWRMRFRTNAKATLNDYHSGSTIYKVRLVAPGY